MLQQPTVELCRALQDLRLGLRRLLRAEGVVVVRRFGEEHDERFEVPHGDAVAYDVGARAEDVVFDSPN